LVPLAALLHSYLIAQRVISAAIGREAGSDSRSRGAALALTTLTFNYNIAVTTAMADAYVETVQGDLAAAESARLTLVDALLTDQVDDRPELTRRAIGLGFDPDRRQVVVIAAVDRQNPAGRWAADAIAMACGRSARTAFVVGRDDGLVALLDADGPHRAEVVLERAAAQVRRTHGAQLRAGVGTPFVGMSGFRVSYHQARRAARHATGQRPFIVGPQDIRLFDELTAGGGAADLIPQATQKALGDPMLRDTVQAYVDADLSVTTAARAMSLHPNSVRYRLRRVAELTGRDPLKLTDLLELITAARLLGPSD
jgi:sugar diacid utilization regulator